MKFQGPNVTPGWVTALGGGGGAMAGMVGMEQEIEKLRVLEQENARRNAEIDLARKRFGAGIQQFLAREQRLREVQDWRQKQAYDEQQRERASADASRGAAMAIIDAKLKLLEGRDSMEPSGTPVYGPVPPSQVNRSKLGPALETAFAGLREKLDDPNLSEVDRRHFATEAGALIDDAVLQFGRGEMLEQFERDEPFWNTAAALGVDADKDGRPDPLMEGLAYLRQQIALGAHPKEVWQQYETMKRETSRQAVAMQQRQIMTARAGEALAARPQLAADDREEAQLLLHAMQRGDYDRHDEDFERDFSNVLNGMRPFWLKVGGHEVKTYWPKEMVELAYRRQAFGAPRASAQSADGVKTKSDRLKFLQSLLGSKDDYVKRRGGPMGVKAEDAAKLEQEYDERLDALSMQHFGEAVNPNAWGFGGTSEQATQYRAGGEQPTARAAATTSNGSIAQQFEDAASQGDDALAKLLDGVQIQPGDEEAVRAAIQRGRGKRSGAPSAPAASNEPSDDNDAPATGEPNPSARGTQTGAAARRLLEALKSSAPAQAAKKGAGAAADFELGGIKKLLGIAGRIVDADKALLKRATDIPAELINAAADAIEKAPSVKRAIAERVAALEQALAKFPKAATELRGEWTAKLRVLRGGNQ